MEEKKEKKEMTRADFFRCCAVGACSLAAISAAPATALAEDKNPEAEWLRGELDRARVRFARMVSVLEETLDEQKRTEVLKQVGRECARQYRKDTWDKYKGDFQAFLRDMRGPSGWFESCEYDEKEGVLTVTDRNPNCSCPLVKRGVTSATQCLCTLGWQEETYSHLLGKPVKASIVKSVLRGDARCVYRIKVLA